MVKNIILKLFLIAFFLITQINAIYYHELAHKEIYKHYGIDSEIGINFKELYAYTYAKDITNCNDNCILAHDINDIVGYNLLPSLSAIFSILLLLLLSKISKSSKLEDNWGERGLHTELSHSPINYPGEKEE